MKTKARETSEMAAEWVPVEKLTPWAGNPRHNSAAIKEVKASIRRFGFASPIIARKADGMVIAGHTRLAAARELGIERVPVRYLDLDPAEARLLALADNKLGEIAEWDTNKLADALRELDADGALAGLEGIGFTSDEIDALLGDLEPEPLPEGDGGQQVIPETWNVLVECGDESTQARVMELLEAEGYACRALIS